MAERDRPAVVIDLLHIGAGFVLPGEDDGSEGLVDFEEIDVFQLQAGLLQDLGRGRDRTGQHDGRLRADDRLRDDARPRLQPQRLRLLRRHDQHRRGAVTDLAGIARRHHPILLEGWLQLRHLFA